MTDMLLKRKNYIKKKKEKFILIGKVLEWSLTLSYQEPAIAIL